MPIARLAALLCLLAVSPAFAANAKKGTSRPPARTLLELALSVAGATVVLDGKVLSANAERSLSVEVEPGPHAVKASKDGFETVERTAEAKRGETVRVELLLPMAKPPEPPLVAEDAKDDARKRTAPIRIAVYELTVQEGVAERTRSIVSEAVLAEVRKLERTSVVGMREIADMLSFEQQRQLLGCDDQSCLAEIGGALGVDELVTGSVGTLGTTTLFTLRRIDLANAKVLGGVTRRFPSGTGEELLSAIGSAIEELFPEVPLKPGRTRGASIEAARRLDPPPLPTWAFWSTSGASLAALAVAGVFGLSSNAAERDYAAAGQRALTAPVSAGELATLEARATSNAAAANVAFAIAGGLALVAGVEAFFTDWHGYGDAAAPERPVAIVPSANGVVAVARF